MNSQNYKEDYKGCSTFRLEENEQYCETFEINSVPHSTCKQTCDSNNCNTHSPPKTLSCYVCDETVDSNNQTIGYGNPSCLSNNPNPQYIQQCRGEEVHCIVNIETDWVLFGRQTTRIRRACSQTVSNLHTVFNIQSVLYSLLDKCLSF